MAINPLTEDEKTLTPEEKVRLIGRMDRKLRALGFRGGYNEGTPLFLHLCNGSMTTLMHALSEKDSYESCNIKWMRTLEHTNPVLLTPESLRFYGGEFGSDAYGEKRFHYTNILSVAKTEPLAETEKAVSMTLCLEAFEELCAIRGKEIERKPISMSLW